MEALLVLKLLKNFFRTIFVFQENGLVRKLNSISKFMMPSTGKQTIAIHIVFNTSRSDAIFQKKNSQLKEYNVKWY